MANTDLRGSHYPTMHKSTKSYPAGTNVPKSGMSNNRGPATGPRNNSPPSKSASSAVSSSTYQPFPISKNVAGTGGVMSASAGDPDLGALKSPIRRSLAKRKTQGPTKMLGNQASRMRVSSSGSQV